MKRWLVLEVILPRYFRREEESKSSVMRACLVYPVLYVSITEVFSCRAEYSCKRSMDGLCRIGWHAGITAPLAKCALLKLELCYVGRVLER